MDLALDSKAWRLEDFLERSFLNESETFHSFRTKR